MRSSGGVCVLGRSSNDWLVVGFVLGWVVVVRCDGVYVILLTVVVGCWFTTVVGILVVWSGLSVRVVVVVRR